MPRLFALAMVALALAGCNDRSEEIARLQGELSRTKQELSETRDDAKAENAKLQERIDRLELRLGKSPDGKAVTFREELDTLKSELAKSSTQEDKAALEKRIAAMEGRVEKVKEEAVEEARKHAGTGGGGGNVDENKIAEMAAKKLADEQPTKNFQQAIDRLNLNDADKQRVKDEILKSKKEMLELLEVPTADGRRFGEELIDAFIGAQMKGEDANAKIMNLFADLSNTKVPGDADGRTYVQMIEEVKKRNRESIGRILSPEDQKRLSKAHGDWTDFEGIDGDPWGELYMQRMKVWQEKNKK